MKNVLLRAPLLTNSGYGVHSRQIFYWLLEKDKNEEINLSVECLNWGSCSWIIDNNREEGLIREIMNKSVPVDKKYDVTFQVQLPDEWNPSLGEYNVGITAAVETDRCNPKWIDACNKMNSIVVPSTFTKNVLKRSGILNTGIHVIPEWYNPSIDCDINPLNLDLTTEFNFLTVGLFTDPRPDSDRKNLYKTISLLCEKFKDNTDVGIIVKTSMGKSSSFDRKRTVKYFKSMVESIRPNSQYPKVYLLHGDMTNEEMAALYKEEKVKCYVSLTRGEGYGLPLIEAAASGLPIVATNYSGHLQFLEKDSFLPVDYKLIEIGKEKIDNRIFIPGVKWAEPDKESYFTKLDEVYYNLGGREEVAAKNAEKIRESYSREKIMKIYDNKFQGVL